MGVRDFSAKFGGPVVRYRPDRPSNRVTAEPLAHAVDHAESGRRTYGRATSREIWVPDLVLDHEPRFSDCEFDGLRYHWHKTTLN